MLHVEELQELAFLMCIALPSCIATSEKKHVLGTHLSNIMRFRMNGMFLLRFSKPFSSSLSFQTVNCKPSEVCKEEFKTVFRCRCPASGTFFFCKVRNCRNPRVEFSLQSNFTLIRQCACVSKSSRPRITLETFDDAIPLSLCYYCSFD